MEEREERLQVGLEGLESGRPASAVQQGMPEDESALLALAERLRSVEWPTRDPKQVEAQRKQVLAAYAKGISINKQNQRFSDWFKEWRLPVIATAGVMALVFGLIVMIGLGAISGNNQQTASVDTPTYSQVRIEDAQVTSAVVEPILAHQALLVNPHGLVEILSGESWHAVEPGALIEAGAHVRTGALSSAALLFKDGSSVLLGPSSELAIERLNANPDGAVREVVLAQLVGQSEHTVAAVSAEDSRYLVQTPYGAAAAHGTAFHVRVSEIQAALYVTEGSVEMSGKNTSVVVDAGQMTSVGMDDDPLPPTTYITGMGEVTYIGETWMIGGQTFVTHEFTLVMGAPQVGDIVFFEGHVLEDQTRVADLIVLVRRNPEA